MMSHPAGLLGFLSHSLDIKIEIKKRFDDSLEVRWTGRESTTGSPRTKASTISPHQTVSVFFFFSLQVIWFLEKAMHPTPVLLPGKSHGWRSLVGCSPWGR